MTVLDLLRTLRRKWVFVVLGVLAGTIGGWASAPGEGNRPLQYEATHTLLLDPQAAADADGQPAELNFDLAALLVTTGDVPDRVAARLGETNTRRLVRMIDVVPSSDTESLEITATSVDEAEAVAVAQAFGDELIVELVADETATYDAALAAARQRSTEFQAQLSDLDATIAALGEDNPSVGQLEAQRAVVENQYSLAFAEVDTLVRTGAPRPPLLTLEQPVAVPVKPSGLRLPDSHALRALVLGLFGLVLGAAGAVAAQRLDVRIRDKDDLADSFDGIPVIAEIPTLPGRRRSKDELFAVTRPSSPFVEAYRALRTVVLFGAIADDLGDDVGSVSKAHGAAQHAAHRAKVVLVTSPSASEGKTTSAANLATVLGEVGKRVLVVSADFRRPKIHELFEVDAVPGLTEVLADPQSGLSLADLRLRTDVPNVYLLPSGSPVTNPAPFLREAARLVASARELFDFIIVDTAPLLVANDAAELAGVADMVLVLCRAGRTTRQSARRAAEVLHRIGAPVTGTVLAASGEASSAYSYYRNRYYTAGTTRPATNGRGEGTGEVTRHATVDAEP